VILPPFATTGLSMVSKRNHDPRFVDPCNWIDMAVARDRHHIQAASNLKRRTPFFCDSTVGKTTTLSEKGCCANMIIH
jgi:hypothetical protein